MTLKVLVAIALSAISFPALAADRVSAERSLMQGRLDESVASLRNLIAATPTDGEASLLLCRALYAEERIDEAMGACGEALKTLGGDSDAQDWMGRVAGVKADRSGPIGGFKMARKVQAALEAAVRLNPKNGAAVNDLSEYYVNAPGLVGGGTEKATALADSSEASLPQQAHRIRALVAEKKQDFVTAEREFQAAVAVGNRPDALIDLAAYYKRRHKEDQVVATIKLAVAADRTADYSIVDAATLLMEVHKEPVLAEQLLERYLQGKSKSDGAPVVKVYTVLGRMKLAAGDRVGAKIEFGHALELAANYEPARHALQQLQ